MICENTKEIPLGTPPSLHYKHDVTAAMLVSQGNPVGFALFSHVNTLLCFNKFAYWPLWLNIQLKPGFHMIVWIVLIAPDVQAI